MSAVAPRHDVEELVRDLLGVVPDERRVTTSESVRRPHGEPLVGHYLDAWPDVVVFAESAEEVAAVLAYANGRGVAVVPYGAGTSAEGETVPVRRGISLELTGLDRIEIRPGDLQATVGAGVTRNALNAAAAEHGLWFPVDPGADATLGGMTATNASGTTTVRYGSMRQNVLEARVVLADGRVVRTGTRTVKTSAGYNLVHLFIGSEGTLGIVTEVTVRLYGIPEHVVAVRAAFPDLDAACACATALVGAGVAVTRIELLDHATIDAVNAYKGWSHPVRPHLFIELGGSRAGVEGDLEAAHELADVHGAETWDASADAEERTSLWSARHEIAFALQQVHPGKTVKGTDTCVPVSQLPEAVRFAREAMEAAGLEPSVLGHVGDGNYHCMFAIDDADPTDVERVARVNDEIVRDCLSRGGTCSGEHGIGLGKMHYLEAEHGDLLPLMRGVKSLLDPNGILNPGKLFTP